MSPDITPAQVATIIGAQLSAALAVAAAERVVTGGIGLILPISALFVGGVAAFYGLGLKRERWPQRSAIQRAALLSGGTSWALSAAGYVVAYAAMPDAFDFGWLALAGLAPLVALLPGLSALILTMCAGDAAATALRSYDELREDDFGEVDLYERFTVRTRARYEKRHGNRDRAKISGH